MRIKLVPKTSTFGDRSGPSGILPYGELNVNQSYNIKAFGSRSHPHPILTNDRTRRANEFGSFGSGFGSTSPQTGSDCPIGGSWETWCDCMWPAAQNPDLNKRCRSQPFPGGFIPPWTDVGVAARGLPDRGSWVASLVSSGLKIAAGATGGVVQSPPPAPPNGQIAVQVQAPATTNNSLMSGGTVLGMPSSVAMIGVLALGGYFLLKDK